MDDGLKVLLVFVAIVVGAVLFVKALSHEDAARRAAGGWHPILSWGYATKTGWVMGIGMLLVVWFLWAQIGYIGLR
jgi:hypothetical protein